MLGARLLLAVTQRQLTLGILFVLAALAVAIFVLVLALHLERRRRDRRRGRVRGELEPVFTSFVESDDRARLAEEFRVVNLRLNAAERGVAAALALELMAKASSESQLNELRHALDLAGLVEGAERGTRRWSPWRRAISCEVLGKIGARRSVPVLLARLKDRRAEVRTAAVRALGEVGSGEAVLALSEAFLERRCAPPGVVTDSLRRIGGKAAPAFELGILSPDPVVRVSSCFGLSAIVESRGNAVDRLAEVLASDSDVRVRAAAAAALGLVGGDDAPAALVERTADPDVHVRRAAVTALGFFDDPAGAETLIELTEDEDREVALCAAEALLALARRPRAAAEARARLQSSSHWSVEYARTVAEVTA